MTTDRPPDKHSPGPWVVRTVPTSCGQCHKVGPEAIAAGDHGGICLYDDHTSLNPHRGGEQLANAHLIAAAPDLLALARQYASECSGCDGRGFTVGDDGVSGRGPDDIDPTRYACEDCADIRAVIAKAGGVR